ncbi:MAG: Gfo/Idh/MocA family oxidoreductase [Pseudomonadota bacterium]
MNIAVVGCGYWGPNLIRNFAQLQGCEMAMCCDLDRGRLAWISDRYPSTRTTTDVEEIFSSRSIDAVCIATPVATHMPLVRRALEHDKHVLVEKPITWSTSECLELVYLAERHGRVLMVGHTFEYAPAVLKTKEIVDSGELGDILYIFSSRANLGLFQTDINVIWDLAPHDVSIINFLTGRIPETVNAQGMAHYRKNIEDVATLTLTYANGTVAFIHNSWLDPKKVRRTTVVGSKKMLVYDDIESQEKVKIYDKGVDCPPYYDNYGEFQFSYRYGDIYVPRIEDHEPLRSECGHFLECIREGRTPRTDGWSGYRVVAILEAAQQSLQAKGAAVAVTVESRIDVETETPKLGMVEYA